MEDLNVMDRDPIQGRPTPERESKGTRASALWGRRKPTTLGVIAALALPLVFATSPAAADGGTRTSSTSDPAYVAPQLLASATDHPNQKFDVIISGDSSSSASQVGDVVDQTADTTPGTSDGTTADFGVIDGVSAQVTGAELTSLADEPAFDAIVPDATVAAMSGGDKGATAAGFNNTQIWSSVSGVTASWTSGKKAPTIAIVDSGVDAGRADFAGRFLGQVDFAGGTTDGNTVVGDGYGHGTLVAGIAAGAAPNYAGMAPTANILSLDVMNDKGEGKTSAIIAAANWIYKNRAKYNIKVANFSLTGSVPTSFQFDPLDKAVEKLWNAGVTVVAAAGNYGTGSTPSGVVYAPGNDPFVITVGAIDTKDTLATSDDFLAPWSAWGYTPDGFA